MQNALVKVFMMLLLPHTTAASLSIHAMELRKLGYTIVNAPVADVDCLARLRTFCSSRLSSLLDEVKATGYDTMEQQYQFAEICHRSRKRWDMRIDQAAEPDFAALVEATLDVARPIIQETVLADLQDASECDAEAPTVALDSSGAVISIKGAKAQRFHTDAGVDAFGAAEADPSQRLFNVFVPLVEVEENTDGTQFWPGSHLISDAPRLAREDRLVRNEQRMQEMIAPAIPAGGVLIFDYRVVHRGLKNGARERPIAYAVCSTGNAKDQNFPQLSIRDATSQMADLTPTWDEADHMMAQQISWQRELDDVEVF